MFPENTLYAYEHSMAMGGEVVDVDLATTADGVLVAMHDSTVDRTTNGTGQVRALTWPQLSKLDAGWGFHGKGGHPFRGKGITVPSIEQILRRFPSTLVTLDLKDQRPSVAAPLCALLTRLRRTADVYVGSDSSAQVDAFRSTCPSVRTSGTDAERRAMRAARASGDRSFTTRQLVSQPPFRGDDGVKRVTAASLAFSHSKGIAVLTWVVDDPKDMRELIDLGVDGIYTRRPDVLIGVLREHHLP